MTLVPRNLTLTIQINYSNEICCFVDEWIFELSRLLTSLSPNAQLKLNMGQWGTSFKFRQKSIVYLARKGNTYSYEPLVMTVQRIGWFWLSQLCENVSMNDLLASWCEGFPSCCQPLANVDMTCRRNDWLMDPCIMSECGISR